MAVRKRAIILCMGNKDILEGGGDVLEKFLNRATAAINYTGGPVAEEAADIPDAVRTDAAGLEGALTKKPALLVADLGTPDAAALELTMQQVLKAADRHTLIVLAGTVCLYFYGLAIRRGASFERKAFAKDVVPTVCYIADLPVPETTTGAVLYQALKDPNLKLKEILKLKEGLARMETALQRETREPWDKHDCA